ncbi:uncharacterized protein LOC130767678 isoform X2 [Actinidia eriantha]|uniref:uncharacterized protein LOC130767616 isoform X2 n=1 Tax=Actinidia eriantha TaxID=165200 RepID=UPI00258FAE5F|nr:uncharacterized protein LOC130767616 isoform X2 [Actinidia eriantha]XP_057480619.1 uncharacterized protein LOC130767678 isoform X2 [Actinidia eriantha]
MASTESNRHYHHHSPRHRRPTNNLSRFLQSTTSNLFSLFPFHNPKFPFPSPISPTAASAPPPKICDPILFADSSSSSLESTQTESSSGPSSLSSSSLLKDMASGSTPGFPATVRISSLRSTGKGGPAFVGQVFSMCDLSGTGLMAVSTHFDIPFITKRTPEWIKKIFTAKSERNGPVFRFFMDLGDAVSYVKRLNIPSGVVGACRLDLAYEHFKEKPHLFQFVPNEKQVKEANKLLKIMSHNGGRKKVDGVPVFSAQNLDIAIATTEGIQWYTPYFFDKNMLDNILEESVDQHFHTLIQTRNVQRRRDAIDDNLSAEMIEETGESIWEPPEEVLNEVGDPGIPLSVISKAAEIQLLYAVDKVLLGNRWLRKATGIQPKFPYMVDSFEERSAASLLRASNSQSENNKCLQHHGTSKLTSTDSVQAEQGQRPSFQFPFEDWSWHPFSKLQKNHNQSNKRVEDADREYLKEEMQSSPLLPRITMVGISTVEAGQVSKASLKKTMEDLTKELEQTDQGNAAGTTSSEFNCDDRDPLFVANVGDYYSGAAKTGSVRWVRGGN